MSLRMDVALLGNVSRDRRLFTAPLSSGADLVNLGAAVVEDVVVVAAIGIDAYGIRS